VGPYVAGPSALAGMGSLAETPTDVDRSGPVEGVVVTPYGNSWAEALKGGFEIGGAMVTPFFRPRRLRWGATDPELEQSYPGDELIPEPKWSATHAISIEATPQRIWPWIAQLGQGRGGFYAYQKLENLVGCQVENTCRVLDEHQHIRVGDPIRLHVQGPPMTVAIVEEPTTLVLYGSPAAEDGGGGVVLATSWALLLLAREGGGTRFLSRTRYHHADDRRSAIVGGPTLLEPVSFVMERKMLTVIKALAESTAA
jgi:hypothetical protein